KYVPAPNYNGLDSFTYKANDGHLDSTVATVTITVIPVNDAPAAVDDSYSVNEDTTLHLDCGLKISSGYSRDAAGDATACADTGEILVPNNESYTFSVDGAVTDSATLS